jgi:CHAT domain-containing protein
MALCAQQAEEARAAALFQSAEKNFFADKPTEATDRRAVNNYREVIRIYESMGIHSIREADSHQRLASIALGTRDYASARSGYHQSLQIKKQVLNADDSVYFQDLIYLGNVHYLTERLDSAEWYYLQAQQIAFRYPEMEEVERIYNSLGAYYFSAANYLQAINYYKKALNVLKENDPDYLKGFISFTYNIANAQSRMKKYPQAISSYHDLLNYGIISDHIYLNLGTAYARTQQYDSAEFYLTRVLDSSTPELSAGALNTMGHLKLAVGQPDTALVFFNQSLKENQKSLSQKNSLLARTYFGLGKSKVQQEEYASGLTYFQKALQAAMLQFEEDALQANPQEFSLAISLPDLFNALEAKAEALALLSGTNNSSDTLQMALSTYETAIRLARYIQKTFDSDEAKLFLVQEVYPVYEKAIGVAAKLYRMSANPQYLSTAMQFSENSKAAVLSEILDDLRIRATAQISDSLVREERLWKQKITRTRMQLAESTDSAQSAQLQVALTDHEIALASTLQALQQDEKYYRLKYQEDSFDLEKLQQSLLGDEDALLEYFLGEDKLYTFLISRDAFTLSTREIDSTFLNAIENIKSSLYQYEVGDPYQQAGDAYLLYQYLLEPQQAEIHDKQRLIIVPDGALSFIPFEILNDSPAENNYLIHRYAINYAYSASLLEEVQQNRRAKEFGSVLAMAPFAGDEEGNIRSNGFSMLFSSKEEVENVGGSIYLEDQATKRLFLDLAGSYGIVHLATHASISSEDPLDSFIAFYPDRDSSDVGYRLYTHELYNLRLDSVELVVLSACEAGNGKLVKGEGIISLARAFAYAGCPNIMTTLWKAQDKSTAAIASGIHDYLRKGYSKDQALRQAKLDYLNAKDVHPMMKTPYYWANFIFIGDPTPIYPDNDIWWWVLASLVIIGLLYWLLKKSTSKLKQA